MSKVEKAGKAKAIQARICRVSLGARVKDAEWERRNEFEAILQNALAPLVSKVSSVASLTEEVALLRKAVVAARAEAAAARKEAAAAKEEAAALRAEKSFRLIKDWALRVDAFRAFDKAKKEQGGGELAVAAGVLADFKANRQVVWGERGPLTPKAFLKLWREWVTMGRPSAGAYMAKREAKKKGRRVA